MHRRNALMVAGLSATALIAGCGGGNEPEPLPDIFQLAQTSLDLTILVEAFVRAGLVGTLQGAGPFTVFAPTNSAFAALFTELGLTTVQLLANIPLLTTVLSYHLVPRRVLKADIPVNTDIATVQGETLRISSGLVITDQRRRTSRITATDVLSRNGVIHFIDKLILPRP